MLKTQNAKRVIAAIIFLVMCAAMILSGYNMQNTAAAGGTEYVKYDCTTRETLSYTLPQISQYGYSNAMMLADTSDGDVDNRYVAPNDQMLVKFGIGNTGTGFIIGDHEIMTAGHCVYNTLGFVTLFPIMINTTNPSGNYDIPIYLSPVSVHIPKKFKQLIDTDTSGEYTNDMASCDFAIVTVKEDLSKYGKFYLGVPTQNIVDNPLAPAHTLGYFTPNKEEYPNLNYDYVLKKSNGIFKGVESELIYTSAASNSGTSGGPFFIESRFGIDGITNDNYKYRIYRTVVGIVGGRSFYRNESHSFGAKVDSEILQFAYKNDYL